LENNTSIQELTQEQIICLNLIKEKNRELLIFFRHLLDILDPTLVPERSTDQVKNWPESLRWLNIGRTHIQQGLMAWSRAVNPPEE
jgi:hypothetical protein